MVAKRQCGHLRIKAGGWEASPWALSCVKGERNGLGVSCPGINNIATSPSAY